MRQLPGEHQPVVDAELRGQRAQPPGLRVVGELLGRRAADDDELDPGQVDEGPHGEVEPLALDQPADDEQPGPPGVRQRVRPGAGRA